MDMIIGLLLIVSIIFIIIGIHKNLKISPTPTSNQIYEPPVVDESELNKYSMFKDISAWMNYPF